MTYINKEKTIKFNNLLIIRKDSSIEIKKLQHRWTNVAAYISACL